MEIENRCMHQSCGKSSVLESIVHRPFLPRGSGIVTRCPLVLQLIENKGNDAGYDDEVATEWGEFLHLPKRKFTDFDDIRKEIERRTDELAGRNKGICHEPINLKIYSPNVVDLTLVDLPGITKVPVGDQPQDIEAQIKKLIMLYIKNTNSIILSVSAANSDLATSESIKYAKLVDPNGLRTLSVLTKLDLMDKGTDANEILSGKDIHIKLGIIGTVNRSQQDINDNKTINQQIEDEKEFFEKNYNDAAHQNGISYLSKRLSQLLMNHIQDSLPDLKIEVDEKLNQHIKNYELCGQEIKDKNIFIMMIVTEIMKKMSELIDGLNLNMLKDAKNLVGGPKIRKIFDETFGKALKSIKPDKSTSDILQCLLNHGGPRPAVFASESIFEKLVNEQIEKLRNPSMECVQNSHDEMENVISKVVQDQEQLVRFPILGKKIHFHLKQFLKDRLPIAKEQVNELINIELSCINTNHPDFSIENAIKQNKGSENGKTANLLLNLKTEKNAEILFCLVENYFPIVKQTVQDQVPKIIMYKVINHMKNNIQNELLNNLLNETDVNLLQESEENENRRQNAKVMIQALKAAQEAINEIRMQI
ncbi:hypothetical protein ACKWTF_003237 [Chironomus riparius]